MAGDRQDALPGHIELIRRVDRGSRAVRQNIEGPVQGAAEGYARRTAAERRNRQAETEKPAAAGRRHSPS